MTSLPASEERLSRRLQTVTASFAGELSKEDADYLFVLEDGDGQVVGTSGRPSSRTKEAMVPSPR